MRAIVLPVKSLEAAKARLAVALDPLERAALTLAMLEDVLDVTLTMPGWETWVVSPDETVLEVSRGRGAATIVEEEPPLGAAIRQAENEAMGRGADALAVLLPDTPLLTPAALMRALHTLGPVVLAPSGDDGGTNLLVRRPPTSMPAMFGADSYRLHLQTAARHELPVAVVEQPELAFDVDLPDDILTMLQSPRPTRTREVLRDLRIDERMSARAGGA
jgi:2-phospho-L-lactate/phosphoenolpyruvate guanylyltransferase